MKQVPNRKEFMKPTLDALCSLGGSASIEEINRKVIEDLQLADDLVQLRHGTGSRTEVEYQLYWARTLLKKQGLIDNSTKGVWSLSSQSLATDVQLPDLADSTRGSDALGSVENTSTDEDTGFPDAESWRESLGEILRNMPPDGFERLCQRVMRESGFIEVEVTGRSGDGGIDGKGQIRLGGLIGFPVVFQCKRWNSAVGPNVVRELRGAMQGRGDRGMIITTDRFTRDAQKEATRDGASPIALIDGEQLIDKLRELGLGVTIQTMEVVKVDTDWYKAL